MKIISLLKILFSLSIFKKYKFIMIYFIILMILLSYPRIDIKDIYFRTRSAKFEREISKVLSPKIIKYPELKYIFILIKSNDRRVFILVY